MLVEAVELDHFALLLMDECRLSLLQLGGFTVVLVLDQLPLS